VIDYDGPGILLKIHTGFLWGGNVLVKVNCSLLGYDTVGVCWVVTNVSEEHIVCLITGTSVGVCVCVCVCARTRLNSLKKYLFS
jgi:hypothetical protein